MTKMEELLQRLAEDRRIAERQRLQSRITEAFESARRLPPEATKIEPEVQAELILEPAPIANRPLRALVDRAAPLLDRLAATPLLRRRPDRETWTIDEIPTEAPEKLFDEALTSLGYSPVVDSSHAPMTQETPAKKKWWQK
jgi:hypothetical protein